MDKPLISIVTPAYNAAKYIGATIDSLMIQDMPIEHIIVDDGSTDNTGAVVADKIKQYPEYGSIVKFYRQDNAGEQLAVNKGMEFITGRYFMIVNADDPLKAGCIEELYNALEQNTDYVAAYPDWQIINEHGEVLKLMHCPEWDMRRMVREHRCIPSVGVMYRSEIIEVVGYRDPQFLYVGDFDYFYRVGLVGDYYHVKKHLACWRRYPEQMTAVDNPIRAQQRKVLMDKFYTLPGSADYLDIKNEAYCWAYLVAAAESKPLKRKISYILKALHSYIAILYNPTFWHSMYSYMSYYVKVRN